MDRADAVSRRRRAASIVFPGLLFVAIVIVTLIAGWFGARAGSSDLPHWIDERAALERRGLVGDPRRAEALDVYLAGIFGTDLRGAAFWNSPRGRARRTLRPSIERMLDTHRAVTSRELGRAIEVLQPELDRRAQVGRFAVNMTDLSWMFMVQAVAVAALAALSAFVTGGGLVLRWWGVAVTTGGGSPVSRSHALFRTIVAWSPVLTGGALILGGLWPRQSVAAAAATMLVMTAGALDAVLRPERGVQDWMVGTWLVPS